jgi:hypothetical protein
MSEEITPADPTTFERVVRFYTMLEPHPDVATDQFWDDFYEALKDLVNGDSEQVCLNRDEDRGPIRVEWNPVTIGKRERWPGTGPG